MRHAQGRAGECQKWRRPPSKTESENCSERCTDRPRSTPHGDGRMPAVKDVGEPCAGEPHARFEVAAGGNRNQSAMPRGTGRLPPTLQAEMRTSLRRYLGARTPTAYAASGYERASL